MADVTDTPVGRAPLLVPASSCPCPALQWIAADGEDDILTSDSDATPVVPVDGDGWDGGSKTILFKVVHTRAGEQKLMAVSS